jgi:hypothetical protein
VALFDDWASFFSFLATCAQHQLGSGEYKGGAILFFALA